jgi:prepilin-type N-terminal cleavage/methylation domain-containing protein/prepilin-type processing-associated H-X9-DG protein
MKNQKSGFTLIELLVVIVIISLLAAMLFPVLGRMQESGRDARCVSNLHQLHTAAINFMNASGGRLPRAASAKVWHFDEDTEEYGFSWQRGWVASYPEATTGMKSFWWEASGSNGTYCITNGTLFNYLGDEGDESVYVCPTMVRKARSVMTGEYRNVTRSYGMNTELSNASYMNIDGLTRRMLFADQGFDKLTGALQSLRDAAPVVTAPRNPSDTDLKDGLEGTQRFFRGIDGSIDYKKQSGSNKADTREYLGELHGRKPGLNTGMANVVFADGHVEKIVYTNTTYVCEGQWEYGKPVL